jgi:hypothetical protein
MLKRSGAKRAAQKTKKRLRKRNGREARTLRVPPVAAGFAPWQ